MRDNRETGRRCEGKSHADATFSEEGGQVDSQTFEQKPVVYHGSADLHYAACGEAP